MKENENFISGETVIIGYQDSIIYFVYDLVFLIGILTILYFTVKLFKFLYLKLFKN